MTVNAPSAIIPLVIRKGWFAKELCVCSLDQFATLLVQYVIQNEWMLQHKIDLVCMPVSPPKIFIDLIRYYSPSTCPLFVSETYRKISYTTKLPKFTRPYRYFVLICSYFEYKRGRTLRNVNDLQHGKIKKSKNNNHKSFNIN